MREDTSGITILSHSSMPVCKKQESRLPPTTDNMFTTSQKVGKVTVAGDVMVYKYVF